METIRKGEALIVVEIFGKITIVAVGIEDMPVIRRSYLGPVFVEASVNNAATATDDLAAVVVNAFGIAVAVKETSGSADVHFKILVRSAGFGDRIESIGKIRFGRIGRGIVVEGAMVQPQILAPGAVARRGTLIGYVVSRNIAESIDVASHIIQGDIGTVFINILNLYTLGINKSVSIAIL